MRNSLRGQLLAWVLGPLAFLAALNATLSWGSARAAANLVTDRALLASARSIAEQARSEDGVAQVTVPPAAIEMFDTGEGDFVYYAVTDTEGRLLAGVAGLSSLLQNASGHAAGTEVEFRGRRLRAVMLDHPMAGPGPGTNAHVVVGLSLRSRDALSRHLWLLGMVQQLGLIAAAGLFMLFGLKRGLSPLLQLRDAVRKRPATSLEPLEMNAVQTELQPLVTAINQQMKLVELQLAAQHRFVINAAHQLRTPLTLLSVQATYALRRAGTAEGRDTLEAMRASTGQLSRLAGQLLTLSRAEPGSRRPRAEAIALDRLAARVLDGFVQAALEKRIDLGFDAPSPAWVTGDATLIGELLSNLVDNALRYCSAGNVVTVSVARHDGMARLAVRDNGPGVPPSEMECIFERFYRVPGATPEGSGLGLAIVKEVAQAAGGGVTARQAPGGGLLIEVDLPGGREPLGGEALKAG